MKLSLVQRILIVAGSVLLISALAFQLANPLSTVQGTVRSGGTQYILNLWSEGHYGDDEQAPFDVFVWAKVISNPNYPQDGPETEVPVFENVNFYLDGMMVYSRLLTVSVQDPSYSVAGWTWTPPKTDVGAHEIRAEYTVNGVKVEATIQVNVASFYEDETHPYSGNNPIQIPTETLDNVTPPVLAIAGVPAQMVLAISGAATLGIGAGSVLVKKKP